MTLAEILDRYCAPANTDDPDSIDVEVSEDPEEAEFIRRWEE